MKKHWIAVIGVFLSMMVLGWLLHGILLAPTYQAAVGPSMRPQSEMMAHFHFIVLANLFFALAFVWIYAHGVEDKPAVGQGLRLGIAVWALASLAPVLIGHAVQPWPLNIALTSTAADFVMMVVSAIVGAVLYGKREVAGTRRTITSAA
jgi:hypothetical protein